MRSRVSVSPNHPRTALFLNEKSAIGIACSSDSQRIDKQHHREKKRETIVTYYFCVVFCIFFGFVSSNFRHILVTF